MEKQKERSTDYRGISGNELSPLNTTQTVVRVGDLHKPSGWKKRRNMMQTG